MSAGADTFWATLPLGRGVALLASDPNGVAALSKPAGVLSHPNEAKDQSRSLLTTHYDAAAEAFQWKDAPNGEARRVWLLNRLDSGTSGVLLVAREESLAREIRAGFREKHVNKVYQALVFGKPPKPSDVWKDLLAVQKKGGQIRTSASAGHVPAESRMTVIRAHGVGAGALALIQLEPRTGRSHQLRVQCAKRHLPIVGDATYGDFRRNREFARLTGEKRMFLHSFETRFTYTWKGRTFAFAARAELPAEFRAALG